MTIHLITYLKKSNFTNTWKCFFLFVLFIVLEIRLLLKSKDDSKSVFSIANKINRNQFVSIFQIKK